jgi:AGCS family alanine or glycine:cation symporter
MTTAARRLFALCLLAFATLPALPAAAQEDPGFDERLNAIMAPIAKTANDIVFYGVPIADGVKLPIVLAVLGLTAVFLTIYFKFINLRAFGLAFRTVKGKYSDPNAPGQITHFQALSAALSATVGLGNIGGVAVAISVGGPGATFWMIMMGLCGMTTKFAECTLGVKYRRIMKDGTVKGGAMYYLRDGLKEIGLGPLGTVLAILFAIFVIGGAFGAGNMYQANQSYSQFATSFPGFGGLSPDMGKLVFGSVFAVLVGLVIIGGIVWIARVTAFLVPFMCGMYMLAALTIIFTNLGEVGPAFASIFKSAFGSDAVVGGFIGVLIQGIRRAAFSNEAGLGSAPIAHAAVKTDKPASEGIVALLEPFVDTVVVCTMTALVLIITGVWQVSGEVKPEGAKMVSAPNSTEVVRELPAGQLIHTRAGEGDFVEVIALVSPSGIRSEEAATGWVPSAAINKKQGVEVTSLAFGSKISWFPTILTVAVILFAFSTMISWSYYGQQGVMYLFSWLSEEKLKIPVVIYKVAFCLLTIVGCSASLGNVLDLTDAMVFAMVVPNLIGVYLLLPVIRRETTSFLDHVKKVDRGEV